jgi:hypothetical protein
MRKDRDALFDRGIDDPITIDGHDDAPAPPTATDGNSAKRSRPSTSPIWDDFEKSFKTIDGKTVRYGARFLHCSKEYSALSLVVALATSPIILLLVLRRVKRLACLSTNLF